MLIVVLLLRLGSILAMCSDYRCCGFTSAVSRTSIIRVSIRVVDVDVSIGMLTIYVMMFGV